MRQSGYRVRITVLVPFDRKDNASHRAALEDVTTLEGVASLCKSPGVTMDIEAVMTSWDRKEAAESGMAPNSDMLAAHGLIGAD